MLQRLLAQQVEVRVEDGLHRRQQVDPHVQRARRQAMSEQDRENLRFIQGQVIRHLLKVIFCHGVSFRELATGV